MTRIEFRSLKKGIEKCKKTDIFPYAEPIWRREAGTSPTLSMFRATLM